MKQDADSGGGRPGCESENEAQKSICTGSVLYEVKATQRRVRALQDLHLPISDAAHGFYHI